MYTNDFKKEGLKAMDKSYLSKCKLSTQHASSFEPAPLGPPLCNLNSCLMEDLNLADRPDKKEDFHDWKACVITVIFNVERELMMLPEVQEAFSIRETTDLRSR